MAHPGNVKVFLQRGDSDDRFPFGVKGFRTVGRRAGSGLGSRGSILRVPSFLCRRSLRTVFCARAVLRADRRPHRIRLRRSARFPCREYQSGEKEYGGRQRCGTDTYEADGPHFSVPVMICRAQFLPLLPLFPYQLRSARESRHPPAAPSIRIPGSHSLLLAPRHVLSRSRSR